jgi:hypothetical protein
MKRAKRVIVWGLEALCTLCDRTFRRIPLPDRLWERDAPWLYWIFGCNLATLSAELDERWHTGQWTPPAEPGHWRESDAHP